MRAEDKSLQSETESLENHDRTHQFPIQKSPSPSERAFRAAQSIKERHIYHILKSIGRGIKRILYV